MTHRHHSDTQGDLLLRDRAPATSDMGLPSIVVATQSTAALSARVATALADSTRPAWDLGRIYPQLLDHWERTGRPPVAPPHGHGGCAELVWCITSKQASLARVAADLGRLESLVTASRVTVLVVPVRSPLAPPAQVDMPGWSSIQAKALAGRRGLRVLALGFDEEPLDAGIRRLTRRFLMASA